MLITLSRAVVSGCDYDGAGIPSQGTKVRFAHIHAGRSDRLDSLEVSTRCRFIEVTTAVADEHAIVTRGNA